MFILPVPPEDDHFDPVYENLGLEPINLSLIPHVHEIVDVDDSDLVNCPLLHNDNKLVHVGELLPVIDFL